jgi:exodeoxyribonuclease V gamma subunit
VRERAALSVVQARSALRELVALYREGLREPLPIQARSAWRWYAAPRTDEAAELAAWKLAREQWAGCDRTWGDANNAAVHLALRGRDPFAGEFDDPDGVRFRELATRLFDALVHGRDVDARTGDAA